MSEDNNLSSETKHIASTQEKIDAIFGITGGKSVDDFLDDLSLDTQKIEDTMSNIDASVKDAIVGIDKHIENLTQSSNETNSILELKDITLSLKSVEELIGISKQIFKHIADSILSTDLIDSELVHAAAVLIESIHISIKEFISIYQSKQNFVEKIKMQLLKQEQAKELLEIKHQYALDILKQKKDQNVVDVTENSQAYRQEDILNILKNIK